MSRSERDQRKGHDPRRSGGRGDREDYEDEHPETSDSSLLLSTPTPRTSAVGSTGTSGSQWASQGQSPVSTTSTEPWPPDTVRHAQLVPRPIHGTSIPAATYPSASPGTYGGHSVQLGAQGTSSNAPGKQPARTLPSAYNAINDDDFQPSPAPRRDFQIGVVDSAATIITSNNKKVGRFVVIAPADEDNPYFRALCISTYNDTGVSNPNIEKAHHVIVYTSAKPPEPQPGELPKRLKGGAGVDYQMQSPPIRIHPNDGFALPRSARLNYAEIHAFEPDVRVRIFGRIVKDSREDYITQYRLVWSRMKPFVRHTHREHAPTQRTPRQVAPTSAFQPGPSSYGHQGQVTTQPAGRAIPYTREAAANAQAYSTSLSTSVSAIDLEEGLADLRRRFERMRVIGQQKNLRVPEFPQGDRQRALAQDADLRDRYIKNINDGWKEILQDRAEQEANRTSSDEDVESDNDDRTVRGSRRPRRRG